MPAPNPTTTSPQPVAGSSKAASPPSPSSSSSIHQVGSRQGTRTRTRTRRNMSTSTSGSHRTPRYTNEDHPLAPHNLEAQGYHSFRCLGVPFHVKKRYIFQRELGIGAYGCVALCRDEVLDCNVAIKKITRVFDKDVLARRALREVAILRHIGMCDNVTALLDFDTAFIDFSEIYLVLSASEADLSQIIRSRQSLSDAHLQYFMAQILRGVRYMHSAKIIHRDLKPGNLLVNADCALRICDFGLARAFADPHEFSSIQGDQDGRRNSIGSQDEQRPQHLSKRDSDQEARSRSRSPSPASDLHLQLYKADIKGKQRRLNFPGGPLTGYVATRWYRAPEVMLCFREGYGPEIDMWSVGCILAELIIGKPMFEGSDYVDQITRINNILGSPPESVMDKIGSERAKTYMKSLPEMPAIPLESLYPNANPEALDLVAKLLTWDPDERLTADEALQHPWLKAYHESNARLQTPQPFDKFAEVEFIQSLRQFKGSLQREADELRLELEAMEEEEAEHYDQMQAQQNTECDSIAQADSPDAMLTGGEAADRTNGSGNGRWADDAVDNRTREDGRSVDADALAEREEEEDSGALSCNASSHSGNVNAASTASSSSSVHTPSSISGASADETEPPSPRLYESCRMATLKSKVADHLEEGKALRKPPSFFQLGHEEEGRRPSCGLNIANQHDDVFMPAGDNEVLSVARGLVEHQYAESVRPALGEQVI